MDIIKYIKDTQGVVFTDAQKEAIFETKKNVAVAAVPGAGKTAVFVTRIANLIANEGVSPESIVALTFSKAAAIDMEKRFEKWFKDIIAVKDVNFSTIHSFSLSLIKRYSNFSKYTIAEGDDATRKTRIISKVFHEVTGDYIDDDSMTWVQNGIGYVKNAMIDPKDYDGGDSPYHRYFAKIYHKVTEEMHKNLIIDFDIMLEMAYELLKNNENIRKSCQEGITHIQIDEYQDTSKLQAAIIKEIFNENLNLFVVGDDDQSIYKFRGASPEDFLNFTSIFPNSEIKYMEDNFRSTNKIIKAGNQLIKNNIVRYQKNIIGNKDDGTPIEFLKFKNLDDQTDTIIRKIKQHRKDFPDETVAILARNNVSLLPFVTEMIKNNISFDCQNLSSVISHWAVNDIIAYIEVALGNYEAFGRIYNKHYLRKDYVMEALERTQNDKNANFFTELYYVVSIAKGTWFANKVTDLDWNFRLLGKKKPTPALDFIEYELEYIRYIDESMDSLTITSTVRGIFNSLRCISDGCNTLSEFLNMLKNLGDTISQYNKSSYKEKVDVILKTAHGSKGLEFDTVFFVDVADGVIPTSKCVLPEEYEEERRLFYVAMTRAKKNLYLSYQEENTTGGENKNKPSRFLNEFSLESPIAPKKAVPDSCTVFVIGEVINHKHLGQGIILDIDLTKDTLKIDFNGTIKIFSYSFIIGNNLISA